MSGILTHVRKERAARSAFIERLRKENLNTSLISAEHAEAYEILSKLICEIAGWKSLDGWVDDVIKKIINREHVNIDDLIHNIEVWKASNLSTASKEE